MRRIMHQIQMNVIKKSLCKNVTGRKKKKVRGNVCEIDKGFRLDHLKAFRIGFQNKSIVGIFR